ncbi:MAG: efflux RND transporter permease subunit [Rikenellaceae bacterium]
MVQKFISRPVLSTVLSILIVLIGLLGLSSLPMSQYPDIAPPMVKVTTSYPGANAEVVQKSVMAPLEEQINGVENMTYIVSTSSNDGSGTIEVYFELGTDPDMAAVNVQNRVSAASSKLPSTVTQNGVTTEKVQNNMLLVVSLYSENPEFDETFLQNYSKINLLPMLQRVNGVGRINVFGAKDYSMRVWLDPAKMASYNLSPTEVSAAIQEQNLEAAPGKFGENSNQAFQYTIKYKGKYTTEEEYENIVIRTDANGNFLKLKDVARVEFGSFNYGTASMSQGETSSSMAIYQMAGSNANEVVNNLKATIAEAQKSMPPGIEISIPYDTNLSLEESIKKVLHTFLEAFFLVFIVVYVFLQDLRSTLIPVISSLVAIIGTFFFLQMFGFSINLLTLFALVLAIGMVVDDAIVVVEAVHAKLEHDPSQSLFDATSSAMHEITGAVISITFVMSAVFFPVSFMSGPTGVFYRQFAITLAVAMILSAINALTLSPVLCVLIIKHKGGEKVGIVQRLQDSFNAHFEAMTNKYKKVLETFAKRRFIPIAILLVFALIGGYLMKTTPTGFIPNEDQGMIMGDISLPAGSSLERSIAVAEKVDSIQRSIPEISQRLTVSGVSILTGSNGGSYSLVISNLVPWNERERDINQVLGELYAKTSQITEGRALFFVPPAVPGFGVSNGLEIQLQDRTGGDLTEFSNIANEFIAALSAQPEIQYATTGFNVDFPQYEFSVDIEKCKLANVSVSEVFSTMQTYYGSMFVSDFNRFTKYYRVMVQADPEDRTDLNSIYRVMVKNNLGEMVPISTLVDFKRVYGPEAITRYNLFTAATITGVPNPGFSTGDAIAAVSKAAETLPQGYSYEFSGMTREEIKAGNQQVMIFALCFIFVYLILCAQYESYILPLSVMIPLVIGIAGVFIGISALGIDNNIYVQVALIMLIGLLAKNGILIVEFARQRRDEFGLSIKEAAIEGAAARLRPILMTSFAFIFGMIPLMIATGAGAAGNNSIGTAAASGMLIGTVFGVFVIPSLFIIFKTIDEKMRSKNPKLHSNPHTPIENN